MLSTYIKVQGIVQGVGFRPFVYNLALNFNLKGYVNNDDRGVNILLQGNNESINNFIIELKTSPPPLSNIHNIEIENRIDERIYEQFLIIQSETTSSKSTVISPDMSVCKDCIEDIKDTQNFRHNYALTNCTNCGPRYSIIKTVPYDRINTSMANFEMCDKCKQEYLNPLNRRYHAQPVSCEKCGPQITLYDNQNNEISKNASSIKEIAQYINHGKIVAIKGVGGFHIVCDACNYTAIQMLRERKQRPSKPFAVMFKSLEQIEEFTCLNQEESEIIISKEKPITLVKKREFTKLANNVAPNIDRLGVFLPYTPLHILLFDYLDHPIIATSANLSDEPIIRNKNELLDKLSHVIDYVLDFNREIINTCDDSVVQCINQDIFVMRNARGYAPTTLKLPKKIDKKILAIGANQKNTIALAFEDNLILSPHIGDLKSITAMEYFKRTIETFKTFYDFEPDMIICDKHPNYETTKWAKFECSSKNIELKQIQHHYAHALSTMAEYNLGGNYLSFIFDGTGYGDDGTIWGGEVFLNNRKAYERIFHIKNFKLLGSEKAIKEPKRVALSLLFDTFSLEEIEHLNSPVIKNFNESELKVLYTVWQRELNAPKTSSVGRLFDAISSFANILHEQSYEGETGLMIEQFYDHTITQSYTYKIDGKAIDLSSMVKEIILDNDTTLICTKFINMLCNLIIDISNKNKELPIILSGGVFQNKTLLEKVTFDLKRLNRTVFYSKKVPLNDAGISMGQIYSQL